MIAFVTPSYARIRECDKSRIIVTTDLGGTDPDDIQSMIHLLLCSDIVDIEGIISSQTWDDLPDNSDLIKKYIDIYARTYQNLLVHSDGFADPEYLKSITMFGQEKSHMDSVGEGLDSDGSEHIIATVDRKGDKRPVWLLAWGGTNTIAQALWKVRETRSEKELKTFISKIRVYDILGQDDAGAWIAKEFPELVYIRNTEVYGWGPSDSWIDKNVQGIGPLGQAYPDRIWATEGDSPAFMFLLANGLNVPEHIDYGGWGGRFSLERKAGIRGMSFVARSGKDEAKYDPYYMYASTVEGSLAIIKWQEHIWNNLAARIQWSVTDKFADANHHPAAAIGRDKSLSCIYRNARAGETLTFDAGRSKDPDNDDLSFRWSIYREPGTYKGDIRLSGHDGPTCRITIPEDGSGKTVHLILEVTDNGTPALTAYRRIVIRILKS